MPASRRLYNHLEAAKQAAKQLAEENERLSNALLELMAQDGLGDETALLLLGRIRTGHKEPNDGP